MKSFWIHNITNQNISLRDLNLTIPARKSVNLLKSSFRLSEDQVITSYQTGSLFAKRDKLKHTEEEPIPLPKPKLLVSDQKRITSMRSAVTIEEKRFAELPNSDESFADEFSGK